MPPAEQSSVNTKFRLLILDHQQMMIDGLKAMLSNHPNYEVVADSIDPMQALGFIEHNEIDIIVTEIALEGMDGIEFTEKAMRKNSKLKVLALSTPSRESDIGRIIAAGASGFVLKTASSDELIDAIAALVEGKNYFSADVKDKVMESLVRQNGKEDIFTLKDLTKREIEVLKLVVKEYTNQEIAEELFISTRTVDAHRRNILHKVGAKNAVGLTKFAISQGLVED